MINNPKSRNHDLIMQEVESEVLIYDLNRNMAYRLNKTSASVWRMCDGKTSVGQMRQKLAAQTNQPIGDEIIWLTLDILNRNNLLVKDEDFKIEFGGLPRREVIKKIGLATMIALPVVSSLVAPTAAMATTCGTTTPVASGCPIGFNLQILGTCADTTLTDGKCDLFYGNSGFISPLCVGASVTNTCSQSANPVNVNVTCKCA